MRLRIKITSFFITASILISTLAGTTANAAGFTKKDLNNIHRIQEQYALLPKMRYNQKNIYHKEPHYRNLLILVYYLQDTYPAS